MMNCPKCNKEVSPEWELCQFCGYEPKKCSNPGCQPHWLPQDAKFCPQCGAALVRRVGGDRRHPSDNPVTNKTSAGDVLCADNTTVPFPEWPVAGKTAIGVVFYVDGSGEHGWAVNLRDQGSFCWTAEDKESNAIELSFFQSPEDAISDIDGKSNTSKIRTANNALAHPAAFATDFDHGWFLPACGQLKVLMDEFDTINKALDIVHGEELDTLYWSSTQCTNNKAWTVFITGSVYKSPKFNMYKIRSIRTF